MKFILQLLTFQLNPKSLIHNLIKFIVKDEVSFLNFNQIFENILAYLQTNFSFNN